MRQEVPAPGGNPHEAERDVQSATKPNSTSLQPYPGKQHTAWQLPQEKGPRVPWNNFGAKDLKQEACEQIIAAFSLPDI